MKNIMDVDDNRILYWANDTIPNDFDDVPDFAKDINEHLNEEDLDDDDELDFDDDDDFDED